MFQWASTKMTKWAIAIIKLNLRIVLIKNSESIKMNKTMTLHFFRMEIHWKSDTSAVTMNLILYWDKWSTVRTEGTLHLINRWTINRIAQMNLKNLWWSIHFLKKIYKLFLNWIMANLIFKKFKRLWEISIKVKLSCIHILNRQKLYLRKYLWKEKLVIVH